MKSLLAGHVFVFFGNNRHRLKLLFFDGTGLIMVTKRIEQGRFMRVLDLEMDTVSFSELEQLFHGSHLQKGRLGTIPRRQSVEEGAKM